MLTRFQVETIPIHCWSSLPSLHFHPQRVEMFMCVICAYSFTPHVCFSCLACSVCRRWSSSAYMPAPVDIHLPPSCKTGGHDNAPRCRETFFLVPPLIRLCVCPCVCLPVSLSGPLLFLAENKGWAGAIPSPRVLVPPGTTGVGVHGRTRLPGKGDHANRHGHAAHAVRAGGALRREHAVSWLW